MTTATKVKSSANSHIGIRKYSSGHKKIVDGYNSVTPRPVGYKVTYHDDWCDTFVTYIGDITGSSHLIGRECGVQRHIAIFKKLGIWIGRARPQVGDVVNFDWQANGWADHIGFVVEVNGDYIKTTEGNTNGGVGQNTFKWNDWRITGYARPKYGASTPGVKKTVAEVAGEVLVGLWGNGQERISKLKSAGYDVNAVQAEVNKLMSVETAPAPVETDGYLSYNGDFLSVDMINAILKLAKQYDINPVFLITMLHFEGLWGGSAVARLNNNLGGITWSSMYVGNPKIKKEKGSSRPANEGGHYVKYQSVSDFLEDWVYLLRPNHFYLVTGNKSFSASVKGLFKVGGAKYDYAAIGYDHYLTGMSGRRNQIEKFNPGKLDAITKAFEAGKNISGEEIATELPKPSTGKSIDEVAKEVIDGKWGNGENRATALQKAGYDYTKVQEKVNEIVSPMPSKSILEIANEVVKGLWGNGKDRTERLAQAGYDARKVQAKVNDILKPDLTGVARDVIAGKYGNGEARVRNLRAVGYNPDEVQAKVNVLMR